jgi:ATP-binding cassette, subfamily B (MDR/TAP), member 1
MSFRKLFKYQPWSDKTLVVLGVLLGVCGGAASPLMALIFGELIEIFDPNKTNDQIAEAYKRLALWIGVIAAILWVAGYFQYAFLQHMAEKLSFDLRSRYLRALLKQETEFFEKR